MTISSGQGDRTRREPLRPAEPVDVVIVNWNGRRYLPECLRALRRSAVPVRIIVVDGGSEDDSLEYLRAEHAGVEVVALGRNLGYAAGANAGLRRGAARYALVMNPDVILAPEHLAILAARLEIDPSIGAAQGKLYRIAPKDFDADRLVPAGIIDSAGHLVRRTRMVVDRGQGEPDDRAFSAEVSVFSACGAALFLRRATLEDVAPDGEYFDESFFAYKEDIDFCWRARLLGWDIRYVPGAVAFHVRSWTGKGMPPKRRLPLAARRHSWKNHYLLLLKNDRLPDLLRSLPAVIGWEMVRQSYALLRDPALYGALADLVRLLPGALRRRRALARRRRVPPREITRWFGAQPARPGQAGVPPVPSGGVA